MTNVINRSNLDVANTAINTAVGAIFDKRTPGSFQLFSTVEDVTGISVDIVAAEGLPIAREWTGEKQIFELRAYKKNLTRRKFEATFGLTRVDLESDRVGIIGSKAAEFARTQEAAIDRIVYADLLANTATGYDASALLADAHSNVNGSTFDNLTTAALSLAEMKTADQKFKTVSDYRGEPIDGLYLTDLLVGPAQEQLAKQLTGSTRPVAISNAGAYDATSNVVASVIDTNYIGGSVNVTVSKRITGNQWFAFALSTPLRPWYVAMWRRPKIYALLDENGDYRFFNDAYLWSLEFDMNDCAYAWQTAYGSVTA